MQTHSATLTGVCGTMVALVGWDRIYEDQHWTSDVAATAALSAMVSRAAVSWIDSRLRHLHRGD